MTRLCLKFIDGLTITNQGHYFLFSSLGGPHVKIELRSAFIADMIKFLESGKMTETELAELAGNVPLLEAAQYFYFVEACKRRLLIGYSWEHDECVHALLEPTLAEFRPAVLPVQSQRECLTLSRFALLRQLEGRFVLECPDASCRVILRTPLSLSCISRLIWRDLPPDDVTQSLADLLSIAGFTEVSGKPESHPLATWQFHDRLFHACTRATLNSSVGTKLYRFEGSCPSPPALKPSMSGQLFPLHKPDEAELNERHESLSAVMERRKSDRRMDDDDPVSVSHVSELLYRVARIKEIRRESRQDLVSRPVPAGGGIHELEFYVLVRVCAGLNPGLYHYQGVPHALCQLDVRKEHAEAIMNDVALAMGQPGMPGQCTIILASRFPRIAWKYENIAYRLSLLNAGVIIQSLYLVATAMDLACTALGTGNSALFAKATGIDPLAETSIAEFSFGSRGANEMSSIPLPHSGRSG